MTLNEYLQNFNEQWPESSESECSEPDTKKKKPIQRSVTRIKEHDTLRNTLEEAPAAPAEWAPHNMD